MIELARKGRLGSHPDVYGRVAWDSPMPTIKRECGHVGNGRYAHPTQDRLLSLREMAILNGFPMHYRFGGSSLANRYRHVGDAVPPVISYQLAGAISWTLCGVRPSAESMILPGTHLRTTDITEDPAGRVAA
jgi:DNA (cytosine-5)-methyltransferase 1